MYYSEIESDFPSENDKASQSLHLLSWCSDASSFIVLFPSDPSEQKFASNQNVDFLVDLSSDLVPRLKNLSFTSDELLCVQSLDVLEPKHDLRVRI
jgi:hypothetical protein